MKKLMKSILSLTLCFTMILGLSVTPVSAKSTSLSDEASTATTSDGPRTNVVYLVGEPGDTHLEYTYEQNGILYKVIENATEDFSSVNSDIYVWNYGDQSFEKIYKQTTDVENGSIVLTIEDIEGNIKKMSYPLQ